MTQQERLERREARKRVTRIRNAWKRFDKKKPSKEDFLRRGIAAEIIREPVYELSEQDWETLEPVFRAEYTSTLKLDDQNEVTITGHLLPIAHLTLRDRHFVSILAVDGDTEYLKKRAREIINFYY